MFVLAKSNPIRTSTVCSLENQTEDKFEKLYDDCFTTPYPNHLEKTDVVCMWRPETSGQQGGEDLCILFKRLILFEDGIIKDKINT